MVPPVCENVGFDEKHYKTDTIYVKLNWVCKASRIMPSSYIKDYFFISPTSLPSSLTFCLSLCLYELLLTTLSIHDRCLMDSLSLFLSLSCLTVYLSFFCLSSFRCSSNKSIKVKLYRNPKAMENRGIPFRRPWIPQKSTGNPESRFGTGHKAAQRADCVRTSLI